MITAIVLSEDGAARVHLLLESLDINSGNLFDVVVLHRSSGADFFNGYAKTADFFYQKHKDDYIFPIRWVERKHKSLSKDIMTCLESSRDMVCLFNDENILFKRPPSHKNINTLFEEYNPFCLSLRLGNNTVIQNPYESNRYFAEIPEEGEFVLDQFLLWDASKVTPYTNFAIPFSSNGHIFKKDTLKKTLEQSSTHDIYELESEVQPFIYEELYRDFSSQMACPEYSVVIHNSSSKISDENPINLGIDKHDLNTRYLDGKTIDIEHFVFDSISKPFEDFVLRFH